MPESIGEKSFPLVTFILATIMLVAFLFTHNNLNYYEGLFGFIPQKLSSTVDIFHMFLTFVTYEFIHVSVDHLFFNMVFLIIAGLAVEEKLGRSIFLTVFFVSGFIAVIFDIIGRILTSVLFYGQIAIFSSPFVGASGAIFGLIAIASLINPDAKFPLALNLLLVVALIASFLPFFDLYKGLQTSLGDERFVLLTGTIVIILLTALLFIPSFPPLYVVLVMFLFNALAFIVFRIPTTTSTLGHLGGVIGGIIAFFLFGRREK